MLPKFFEKIPFYINIRNKIYRHYVDFLKHKRPQKYADILFKQAFGYSIDWQHPRDLNEFINFLAFKTDTSMWAKLADKFSVREYVKERGCEEILVPLLGHWNSIDNIDFNLLPKSFVLKCNNGSGDAIVVNDKNEIDIENVKRSIRNFYARRFGLDSAEPHYLKIKPCIIAEKNIALPEKSLIDYKIWCFNGKPFCIFTVSNRDLKKHTADYNLYSLNWDDLSRKYLSDPYKNDIYVPKPPNFTQMLEYAQCLSKNFPEVRVDFYNIDGKIFFGEMTFTSLCGRMKYFTPEYLKIMGDQASKFFFNTQIEKFPSPMVLK